MLKEISFTACFIKKIFKVLATIKNKKTVFPNFRELKNRKTHCTLCKLTKNTINRGINSNKRHNYLL